MSEHPTLSVIVPVYNATADLHQCLGALAASHYDDFDVLVVDDGSTEPVKPLVEAFGYAYMRLEGPGGPARARNRGVTRVTGQYVVFIDADVCVHPDTLTRLAATFVTEPLVDAVVGAYDDAPAAPNFLSQYKNLFHHYVHHSCDGEISTFWSGCGAMRRQLFLDFGGFDELRYRRPAIEDIELGTWLCAAGYRIILNAQVRVKHLKRWSMATLFKTDICDRGVPWVRLMLRAGTMARTLNVKPSQRLSVALVYLTVFSTLMAVQWPVTWISTLLLMIVITVINRDFYHYLMSHSGLWFTMRSVLLHWLYFGYCGFCVVWGTLLHYITGDAVRPRTVTRAAPVNLPPGKRHLTLTDT